MYLRSFQVSISSSKINPSQIKETENNTSFNNSKEANIITNNILNNPRVFGRELTNIDPILAIRDKKTGVFTYKLHLTL